jgi:hypothetical protein
VRYARLQRTVARVKVVGLGTLPSRARSLQVGALLALSVGLGTACVSKPTMHLNHAEISGVQMSTYPPGLAMAMTVVVDVYNPNSYDVAIRAMRGQAVLAERYTVPVDFRAPGEGLWLGSERTTPIRVTLMVPIETALAIVGESMQTPVIPYRLSGRADVTASRTFNLEKDDYSLDERGTLSRDQIIAVIPNTLFRR